MIIQGLCHRVINQIEELHPLHTPGLYLPLYRHHHISQLPIVSGFLWCSSHQTPWTVSRRHCTVKSHPCHSRDVAKGLRGAVRLSLMADSQRRAEEAETEIGACLEPATGGVDPCRAYNILIRWYQHVSARAPNPSQIDMKKFRGDFQTLYQREDLHPPGLPLATHADPDKVNYEVPSEA